MQDERPDWLVGIGAHVEVELFDAVGTAECVAFDVVPDEEADFAAGFLGAGTPLAQALTGRRAGETVAYELADIREARIIAVTPSQRAPGTEAAARRQAAARATSKANLDEAIHLALTVNVKWGDYDPEGLEAGWDQAAGQAPSEAGGHR